MDKQIKLVVPDSLYSVLQAEAQATGNSIASLVRHALIEAYRDILVIFERSETDVQANQES